MPDDTFCLNGQKWFASNGSSGLAVATARPEGAPEGGKGLGLYLIASHVEGRPNSYDVEALKDKMGTRGLATAELALKDCIAIEIVGPPLGLRVMMEALEYSRVHNAMAAAGVMHRAYMEALCWVEHRETMGKKLIERPMIEKKLIDLATEWMAGSALAFESAYAFGLADTDRKNIEQKTWSRMMTAVAKYRTGEEAVQCAKTAVELIGGNGYTKDWATERILRDAMVLPVWEGPEQIQAHGLMSVMLGKERGDEVLCKRLDQICAGLPQSVRDLKWSLSREVNDLRKDLNTLKSSPRLAEQVADDVLRKVSDVVAYGLLCQEAGWEMENDQSNLKLLTARHFYQKTFGNRHQMAFVPSELQQHFNDLVQYRTVSAYQNATAKTASPAQQSIPQAVPRTP